MGEIMTKWFMREGNRHHRLDEGIYLHYPNTCNIQDLPSKVEWAKRSTSIGVRRVKQSEFGVDYVDVNYETKGIITFFAPISPNRAAWQRIEWSPDFQKHWEDKAVSKAIKHFLWVARCEEAKKLLPKS